MSVLQHNAQNIAALLPPLLIEAERIAHAVHQGVHGRRRAGTGETFWQFRRYEQGDPVERIDWRQSARTDKIFIREREWEASQTAYLWADNSGSMHYASDKNLSTKSERAKLLMLALASLLLRGGEKVVWLDRRNITAHGKNGLEQIAARMGSTAGDSVPPAAPFAHHAHMILCSDFLMEPEQLEQLMRHYAALNLRGAFVHIIDPAEESFTFQGRVEMLGCENEDPLLVPNATALQETYLKHFAEHQDRLNHLARSAAWFYVQHVTNQQPHLALMQLYQMLAADRQGSR
jgi:uncharacterized protein (DUF58 family)